MKLFTKIALWMAGILASIGIICMILAWGMGVRPADVQKMVRDGKFAITSNTGGGWNIFGTMVTGEITDTIEENVQEITSDEVESNKEEIEISYLCKNIEVEYGAGILDISYGDVSNIQIIQENVLGFFIETDEKEQSLFIQGNPDSAHVWGVEDTSDMHLTIILPKDSKLEEMKLEIGASKANISDITAETISVKTGAGVTELSNVSADEMNLELGAGQLIGKNISVGNLEAEAGVGEADIEISGAETDYSYEVECGIGDVAIGENFYGGVAAKQKVTNPDAGGYMDISCGIGAVTIHFTCDAETGTCVNPSHNHNQAKHHN